MSVGRLLLFAATRFDMPLLTRKQSFDWFDLSSKLPKLRAGVYNNNPFPETQHPPYPVPFFTRNKYSLQDKGPGYLGVQSFMYVTKDITKKAHD